MNHTIKIKRAKGYYVYANNNRRYIDFFQEAGFAILGHRPTGLSQLIKNHLAHGNLGKLSSYRTERLQQGLDMLVPGWQANTMCFSWQEIAYRIGGNKPVVLYDSATKHYLRVGTKSLNIHDSSQSSTEEIYVFLWRPYLDIQRIDAKFHYLIPVIPLPLAPYMLLLCTRQAAVQEYFSIAPFLLAAYTHALYLLIKSTYVYYKFDIPPNWYQYGPYLLHKIPEKVYTTVVQSFFEAGIIISPQHYWPIIIPAYITNKDTEIFKMIAKKD